MSRRVLLVSFFHPELVRGGAQQACYELFVGLQSTTYETILLASVTQDQTPALFKSGATITGFDGRKNEFLFLSQAYDHFWHRNLQVLSLEKFERFLKHVAPDVIHFHHFITFGMEYLAAARKYLDTIGGRLVFTFHEFLAICRADGHMTRTFDHSLCERASSVRCNECFPDYSPEHFSMRTMWLKHHFDMVDVFVAPSRFLRQRYIEWGIPPEKIVHIPNGHRVPVREVAVPAVTQSPEQPRNRFAFFGQLIDSKGLLVLFDAVKILRRRGFDDFTLDVYGSNLNFGSDAFRTEFEAFWAEEKNRSEDGQRARFKGRYELSDLDRLMAGVDWVLVPSIWWEIFGMVVSEAFLFGKPVICSNIGGIGERVRDNVDGLHFEVAKSESLAAVMARAMTERGLWDRLGGNIKSPPTAEDVAQQHVALCYDGNISAPTVRMSIR